MQYNNVIIPYSRRDVNRNFCPAQQIYKLVIISAAYPRAAGQLPSPLDDQTHQFTGQTFPRNHERQPRSPLDHQTHQLAGHGDLLDECLAGDQAGHGRQRLGGG